MRRSTALTMGSGFSMLIFKCPCSVKYRRDCSLDSHNQHSSVTRNPRPKKGKLKTSSPNPTCLSYSVGLEYCIVFRKPSPILRFFLCGQTPLQIHPMIAETTSRYSELPFVALWEVPSFESFVPEPLFREASWLFISKYSNLQNILALKTAWLLLIFSANKLSILGARRLSPPKMSSV